MPSQTDRDQGPVEAPLPSRPKQLRDLLIALSVNAGVPRDPLCAFAIDLPSPFSADEPVGNAEGRSRQDLEAIPTAGGQPPAAVVLAPWIRRLAPRAAAIASAERATAEALGARIVTSLDADYPVPLRELDRPPPVLFIAGDLPTGAAVAVVGPRNADPWALRTAERFAAELSAAGVTVISGFARGVDASAHRAAIEVGGAGTVAVLGCGLGVRYPRQHYALAASIREHGAVLTEFACGRPPSRWHFPVRNRLIAALSSGTLVVQAGRRSGSLITARLALELGREVFAVPGRLDDARSAGSNLLLRDGAHVALEPRDVLEALPLRCRLAARAAASRPGTDELTEALAGGAASVDELAESLQRPVSEVMVRLAELEISGAAVRLPGGRWSLRS